MAFCSKAVIETVCGGDPRRLLRLRVRFVRPVLPGQTISTRIWAAEKPRAQEVRFRDRESQRTRGDSGRNRRSRAARYRPPFSVDAKSPSD